MNTPLGTCIHNDPVPTSYIFKQQSFYENVCRDTSSYQSCLSTFGLTIPTCFFNLFSCFLYLFVLFFFLEQSFCEIPGCSVASKHIAAERCSLKLVSRIRDCSSVWPSHIYKVMAKCPCVQEIAKRSYTMIEQSEQSDCPLQNCECVATWVGPWASCGAIAMTCAVCAVLSMRTKQ